MSRFACLFATPLLVIGSLLAVACTMPTDDSKEDSKEESNEGSNEGYNEGTGGTGGGTSGGGGNNGDSLCASACGTLTACGLCIQDGYGVCISEADCTSACNEHPQGEEGAYCILSVGGCDTNGISACLGTGGGGGSGGGGSCKDIGVPCGTHEECCSGRCDPSPPFPACMN